MASNNLVGISVLCTGLLEPKLLNSFCKLYKFAQEKKKGLYTFPWLQVYCNIPEIDALLWEQCFSIPFVSNITFSGILKSWFVAIVWKY